MGHVLWVHQSLVRLLCKRWDKAHTSAATDAATVGPLVISEVHGRTSQEHHGDLKGLMLDIKWC